MTSTEPLAADLDAAASGNGLPVELAPDVSVGPDMAALSTVKCRFCGESFNLGRGSIAGRNRHEKKEHPVEWAKAKEVNRQTARAGGASTSKGRGTRKTSAGRQTSTSGRQSAAQILTWGVKGLAWLGSHAATEQTAFLAPMAAMLSFESMLAGAELDAFLAGGFVDRLALQPLAGAEDKLKRAGPVVLAPFLVGAIAFQPEAYDELYPMLRYCLLPMLPALVAEMRRQDEQIEAMKAAAAELAEMDPAYAELFAGGGDPIDAIIARIFPAPPPADEPSDTSAPVG